MTSQICAINEDLGIYSDAILELVAEVKRTQDDGREAVNTLISRINKQADIVEALVKKMLAQ